MRITKSGKTSVNATKKTIKASTADMVPATKEQVAAIWDYASLFIVWEDDTYSEVHDYGLSLEQVLKYMDDGLKVYIDEDKEYMLSGNFSKSTNASKKLSANEQALTHIKAAIDILGKSGMKDDVTKDSIANLGIVAMDIKSSIES